MKVVLGGIKPSAAFPIMPYIAARVTRGKGPVDADKVPYAKMTNFLMERAKEGHLSIFEHVPLTWHLSEVSRGCLDQLNRYRLASICMESTRHVDLTKNKLVVPSEIRNNHQALEIVRRHELETERTYAKLIDLGISAESARCVIELGRSTQEIFSCNLREFMLIRTQRLCRQAQEEIRDLVDEMSNVTLIDCPDLFKLYSLAKPQCPSCSNYNQCLKERKK